MGQYNKIFKILKRIYDDIKEPPISSYLYSKVPIILYKTLKKISTII